MRTLSIKWKILLSCLAIICLSGLRGGLAFFVQVNQAKLAAITEATHVAHAIAHALTFTPEGASETSLYRNTQALQAYTMALHNAEQRDIVVVVGNGKAALATLEQQTFDVMLMDIQMPEMDGLEATTAIRTEEQASHARLPIIAMTAHAMESDRERCLAADMNGYIAKPIQPLQLQTILERINSGATLRPAGTYCHRSDECVQLFADHA